MSLIISILKNRSNYNIVSFTLLLSCGLEWIFISVVFLHFSRVPRTTAWYCLTASVNAKLSSFDAS